ncbi:MAG: LPS export ABC transporter permease LptF [Gammaproteobacteria bacterium]
MIVTRYLTREIVKPLVMLSLALVVIFAGYSSAVFLTQAANGVLPTSVVVELIALKTIIALGVLLPIALYLGVVIALGRMYTDSEMTALHALGVGQTDVLRAVVGLALALSMLVGILTVYVRPWCYQQSYQVKARARVEFNLSNIEPGNFSENSAGTRVIFAASGAGSELQRVFMQREQPHGGTQVLYAMQARQERDPDYAAPLLRMRNVHIYDLARDGGQDFIASVAALSYHMNEPSIEPIGFWHSSASMGQLAASHAPPDISEYQWRLTAPVSALLLAILGIPLSRTRPRQGRYANMLTAVLVYAAYYSLDIMIRSWVSQGVLSSVPGVWLAPIALAVIVLTPWSRPLDALRRWRSGSAGAAAP